MNFLFLLVVSPHSLSTPPPAAGPSSFSIWGRGKEKNQLESAKAEAQHMYMK